MTRCFNHVLSIAAFAVVAATTAHAQSSAHMDSTLRGIGSRGTVRLPLEEWAGTLGVATPPGLRVRALMPGAMVTRRDEPQAIAARAVTAVPACPMPIAAPDTASLAPMPVAPGRANVLVSGRIVGCENTLQPQPK